MNLFVSLKLFFFFLLLNFSLNLLFCKSKKKRKKMWTFLGIASFTYLYKKSNMVLSFAQRDLAMVAALFFTAGLLLSYIAYFHGQKLRVSRVLNFFLSSLSLLPVINHLIPQTATPRSEKTEKSCKKVRHLSWTPPGLIMGTKGHTG